MRRTKPARPINRSGVWYLSRRVPKVYRKVETRKIVRISTHIFVAEDPLGARAELVVQQLDDALKQKWQALQNNESTANHDRYAAAVAAGQRLNITLMTPEEITSLNVEDFLERMELLLVEDNMNDQAAVDAMFGKVKPPRHG